MTGLVMSSALMPPNTVTPPPSSLRTQLSVKAPVKVFWTLRDFHLSLATLYTSTAVSGVTSLRAPPTSTR